MDAWIGVVGTLLGAVVGGGVAYLNGTRDRKLEARRDQEKRVTEVAGELLQIVDARERYVHGYLEVVGEFPHDGTPDGEEDPARKTLALLELYAPAPVTTAAREYVEVTVNGHVAEPTASPSPSPSASATPSARATASASASSSPTQGR